MRGAVPGPDGADVGGGRTSRRRGEDAHRRMAPTCRRARNEGSARCISPRVKAISKARRSCWPQEPTSISDRSPQRSAARSRAERDWKLHRRRRQGRRAELRGDGFCRQHAAARRDCESAGAVRAVPARAGRRSKRQRCGHGAAALGGGHVGKRRSESGVRIHRCDERDSRSGRRSCSSSRPFWPVAPIRILPMTQRPPGFAGGHTDVIGATPFLLAPARRPTSR